MSFNPLGALARFFGKGVSWGFAEPLPQPNVYFINIDGTVVYPFSTPETGATSITQLIAELALNPVGSLLDGDIIEVVDNGIISESSTVEPMANDITIRSWGTNGLNRRTSKPTISTSEQILFDSHTNGNTGLKVEGLEIVPQAGCSRVYKGLSGDFSYNIVDASLADSDESIVYAEYGFRMVNNLIKSAPDRAVLINDSGMVGDISDIHHNTIVGWNRAAGSDIPAIRLDEGFLYVFSNNLDGEGGTGQVALSSFA